jgi:DNA modification methylase
MIHKGKNYTLYLGNSLDVLDTLPDNSVDSIVTDPPYEIGFMGKGWDNTGIAFNVEIWKKALRVLKPGGHMVAFNHSRMFHRMMVAIEDAGFEIRDTIMWLYGSGFPKSLNIGKQFDDNSKESNQWNGWGTALKPAYEPIVLARKPIAEQNIAQNVLKWGVGGINIDECRVGNDIVSVHNAPKGTFAGGEQGRGSDTETYREHNGRFPANIIHDGSDEVVSGFPETKSSGGEFNANDYEEKGVATNFTRGDYVGKNDSGSASRFFYTAKASQDDRNEGLDIAGFEARRESDRVKDDGAGGDNPRNRTNKPRLNTHPTVKPTDLMKYLVRLITPKGGVVLDLFMGSGSTGKAVMLENAERQSNYHFIGIDMTKEYVEIAKARIDYAIANPLGEAKVVEVDGNKVLDKPISLFDD